VGMNMISFFTASFVAQPFFKTVTDASQATIDSDLRGRYGLDGYLASWSDCDVSQNAPCFQLFYAYFANPHITPFHKNNDLGKADESPYHTIP